MTGQGKTQSRGSKASTRAAASMAIALAIGGGFLTPGSRLRAHEPPRWSVNTPLAAIRSDFAGSR